MVFGFPNRSSLATGEQRGPWIAVEPPRRIGLCLLLLGRYKQDAPAVMVAMCRSSS